MVYVVLVLLLVVVTTAYVTDFTPKTLGKSPKGERLERIRKSWHFKNGAWQNEIPTSMVLSAKDSDFSFWKFLFHRNKKVKPERAIATVKTDLKELPKDSDLLVWFGHSSYLMQLSGKRILVDPVLVSGSPVNFINRAFKGTNLYRPEHLPAVDYLLISHDHYDHLDYYTVKELRERVRHVVVPLGVGENFEYWGYEPSRITDLDWYESMQFPDGFTFHCMPSQHFSGRFIHKLGLWASFVIEAPNGKKVYVGGDSGYGPHFAKIGKWYPKMNLAILENGQYNKAWRQIHTLPEELPKVMTDLDAQHYITVHHSKFALAMHDWDEPLKNERKAAALSKKNLTVLTIGQVMPIK